MTSKLRSVSVLALTGLFAAHAQGTINFSNAAFDVNAPVFDYDGITPVSGNAYIAQLFAGPFGTGWDSLTPITPTATFGTGLTAGYFFGGSVVIPNVPSGSLAAFQVRVWNSSFATWEAAWTAYLTGDPNPRVGVSEWNGTGFPTTILISPNLGGDPGGPVTMSGLSSFHLYYYIPEPPVTLLALAGAGVLFLRRRHK
jgi:hypothetical protein